jgi:heterodisulfide reductase subunit D
MEYTDMDILTEKSFRFDFLSAISGDKDGNEKIKTCVQCGSCVGSCVAAEGMTVTPRRLWRFIQLGMQDQAMDSMSFWGCTTCGLCDRRCPRGIPMSQIMLSLREKRDKSGGTLNSLEQIMENISKKGNITGDEPQNRLLWLDNLMLSDSERQKLFRDRADTVYFTGCVGALFPQVGGISQSLVKLLLKIDDDFTLLEDEVCCGYPVMAGGKGSDNVKEYALKNIRAIESKGARTVIVSCPTCYYMFKNVYPKLTGEALSFEVAHYSEYLSGCLEDIGGLAYSGNETIVTYHDPCDLGRKLHITQAPRKLIESLKGVELRETRFTGEESKCCGGGGNLEMVNPELSQNIAIKRLNEAMETGASYILSSCQQCKRTLQNAARKTRARVRVMDILEFLIARMEEADKGAAL